MITRNPYLIERRVRHEHTRTPIMMPTRLSIYRFTIKDLDLINIKSVFLSGHLQCKVPANGPRTRPAVVRGRPLSHSPWSCKHGVTREQEIAERRRCRPPRRPPPPRGRTGPRWCGCPRPRTTATGPRPLADTRAGMATVPTQWSISLWINADCCVGIPLRQ